MSSLFSLWFPLDRAHRKERESSKKPSVCLIGRVCVSACVCERGSVCSLIPNPSFLPFFPSSLFTQPSSLSFAFYSLMSLSFSFFLSLSLSLPLSLSLHLLAIGAHRRKDIVVYGWPIVIFQTSS